MKRLAIAAAGLLAAAAGVAGVAATAAAAHATPARAASSATVQLRTTAKGKILVDSHGSVLYDFAKDPKGGEECQKIAGCLKVWPGSPRRCHWPEEHLRR